MLCICLLCVLCFFCFSPLFYCPVVSTTAAGAPVIDYVVDDRTPYRRASRQAAIPLSHISPIYLYLSVALGICCCYDSVLFQLHSLSLSPLDFFPISYAAWRSEEHTSELQS